MIKFYLSLTIFLLSITGVAKASCGGEIRLSKEQNTAILMGKISGREVCEYTFYGKRGQVLSVSLRQHDHPKAFLFLPIEKRLNNNDPYTLPKSGRYTLRVALTPQDVQRFSKPQGFSMQFSLMTKEKNNDLVTGKFGSIVPCDHCTGIETRLTILENGTYHLREKYLGVGANSSFSQKGKWTQNGKIIHLDPDDPKKDDRFLVYKNGSMYWIAPFEASSPNPSLRSDYRLTRQ